MKYYAAVVNSDEIAACCVIPPRRILASFHYYKKKAKELRELVLNQYDVFIDSGAFSADNSGKEIDIDEYCEFLKEVGAVRYATLDVIGDAKATLENHEYMIRKHNLSPIPAFHMGSRIEDLDKLIDFPYIALGGLVFSSGIQNHCDEVWHYLLTHAPKIKVHGFGLTNIELMSRYPWYSVDSSSFKSCKRFGRQNIFWNGIRFKTFSEEEYCAHLQTLGFDVKNLDNKQKWFLYDHFSCESYKLYAEHLHEVNKHKEFDYLTNQLKLL